MKLTPTTRKILQFIADGGDRGRMEIQVISTGGSWPRRYQDLRNAGYVESLIEPFREHGRLDPDRVRATETGRAALTNC